LQNPDIEQATSYLSVQSSSARRIAEKLLTTDMEPMDAPPIPEMDLQQAIGIMKNYITDATARRVPDEKIQKVRAWNALAAQMIGIGEPAPTPAPAMMPESAMAPPLAGTAMPPMEAGPLPPV
jgi:hypothetical protein